MNDWSAWFDALANRSLDEAIGRMYARLDAEVAAREPVCDQSGRCCRFDAFGHLLYVTGLEIARFVRHAPTSPTARDECSATDGVRLPQLTQALPPACIYQVDGLCTTHDIRPMGCRIFFCQVGTAHWQQDLYEQYLGELRRLHDAWSLPYAYMEWRRGLSEAFALSRDAPASAGHTRD